MALTSVAQAVNRQSVAAALAEARREFAADRCWLSAINRAALNLEACSWAFDLEVLVIVSATDPDLIYQVDADGCMCKAAVNDKLCWHRAAYRLLIKASQIGHDQSLTTCPTCGRAGYQYTSENGQALVYFDVCTSDNNAVSLMGGK